MDLIFSVAASEKHCWIRLKVVPAEYPTMHTFPLRTLAPFAREHSLLSAVHNILKMEVKQSLTFWVEGKFEDNVSN